MNEYFSFDGTPFLAVLSSEDTPHWKPKLEATDRPLVGTDRFERSIRSRVWMIELDLWVEPSDHAAADFVALQTAYALATIADFIGPGDPAPAAIQALIVSFEVAPQRGGLDGYRGKTVFGLPGGAT